MKSRSFISKGVISAVVAVSALIAAACSSMFEDKDFALASFSFDGCISTKAPEGNYTVEKAKAGTLHLQSKNGNLKITLSGLTDNCSIKEGYDCRAIKEGSFIYVYVTAKELVHSASCICNVGDIETELSGLENDEYTLIYNYKSSTEDITQEVMFEYSSLLNRKVDFERTMYLLETTLP